MDLVVEHKPGWVLLTLNRPAVRNALNTGALRLLAETLADLASGPCRAVVLTGVGGNFAAGADITEIAEKASAQAAEDPRKVYWAAIRAFPKPLIAAVDGLALGGGFELALMADFMVLGSTARLGLPETNLGLMPGAGGGQRLLALAGRARATRMVLLGEVIDADTALSWGIAAFKSDGPSLPEAESLAAKIALRAPLALMAAKRALVAAEAALPFAEERAGFESLLNSADKTEGISAFFEKRKPNFRGE